MIELGPTVDPRPTNTWPCIEIGSYSNVVTRVIETPQRNWLRVALEDASSEAKLLAWARKGCQCDQHPQVDGPEWLRSALVQASHDSNLFNVARRGFIC